MKVCQQIRHHECSVLIPKLAFFEMTMLKDLSNHLSYAFPCSRLCAHASSLVGSFGSYETWRLISSKHRLWIRNIIKKSWIGCNDLLFIENERKGGSLDHPQTGLVHSASEELLPQKCFSLNTNSILAQTKIIASFISGPWINHSHSKHAVLHVNSWLTFRVLAQDFLSPAVSAARCFSPGEGSTSFSRIQSNWACSSHASSRLQQLIPSFFRN